LAYFDHMTALFYLLSCEVLVMVIFNFVSALDEPLWRHFTSL